MKKNIYKCRKCDNEMKCAERDEGHVPFLIGCPKCGDLMESQFHVVDQNIVPEVTFIKPNNEDEWKVVRDQLKAEVKMKFPKKKERKVEKMTNDFMFRIRAFVAGGGLVQLPSHVVEGLEAYR